MNLGILWSNRLLAVMCTPKTSRTKEKIKLILNGLSSLFKS